MRTLLGLSPLLIGVLVALKDLNYSVSMHIPDLNPIDKGNL